MAAAAAWLASGPPAMAASAALARLAPDPGLLALLGLVLAGIGLALRRRR